MFCVMHIHEVFPTVRAEFSFTKTIGALSRNMSDMMDEGTIVANSRNANNLKLARTKEANSFSSSEDSLKRTKEGFPIWT